ncbi:MAG: hypothetical protein ACI9XO_002202 [Paraglaciecola sp.]|jgi:hypothetical protein
MRSITQQRQDLFEKIQKVAPANFAELALAVFKYQATFNPVFKEYISLLNVDCQKITTVEDIPFLPIQFFKNKEIKTGNWSPAATFSSSGTTSETTSSHQLFSPDFYKKNARHGFQQFYGNVQDYCVLALLPSYLERSGSSLIFMAADFIEQSKYAESGFFLNNVEELLAILKDLQKRKIPTLLMGVSFALLDLAERFPRDLSNIIIMETGGMKGRRKEITRGELHQIFNQAFQTSNIHSEYGMTELFSQAYSKGKGIFFPSPIMRVLAREVTDPLQIQKTGKTGVLNIIDFANLDTCSFIATDDLGRVNADDSFEILGRLDASDVRGCNLLVLS